MRIELTVSEARILLLELALHSANSEGSSGADEAESIRRLMRDKIATAKVTRGTAEIARLRALGLEACDLARDCAAMDVPARIDEIRKELTR